jgi:hypothetical protein
MKELNYNLLVNKNILDNFFVENKNNFEYYGGSIETLCNEIKHVQALRTFTNNIINKDIMMEDINTAMINIYSNKRERINSRLSMYS